MRLFNYLLDLFFPPLCTGCGEVLDDARSVICDDCRKLLPMTEHATHPDNRLSGLFSDIRKVQWTAAFCYYKKDSMFYRLIHNLKYHNRPQTGVWLGRIAAEHFLSQNPKWFEGINIIIPIPLHKKRLYQRRYNQAELIATGISAITGIPIDINHLIRIVNNPTQTMRSAKERKQNTHDIFALVHADELKDKHILLVDDIVTTGATMRSAISVLTPVRGLTISILTMGEAGK